MEFKGNTGNWFIEQDKEFPNLHNIWSKDKSIFTNGTLIARTCYAPLSEFNAKLISKAPEMLEMLKVLVSHYGEITGMAIRSDIDKANALIKEATEL